MSIQKIQDLPKEEQDKINALDVAITAFIEGYIDDFDFSGGDDDSAADELKQMALNLCSVLGTQIADIISSQALTMRALGLPIENAEAFMNMMNINVTNAIMRASVEGYREGIKAENQNVMQ